MKSTSGFAQENLRTNYDTLKLVGFVALTRPCARVPILCNRKVMLQCKKMLQCSFCLKLHQIRMPFS